MKDQILSSEIKKIPDHVFHYIENELQLYRTYKRALAELEADLEDLVNRSPQLPFDEVHVRNNSPSDIVNLTVVRSLVIEEKIKEKLSRIRKIEAGLKLVNDEERNIIELKYFSGIEYTNDYIIEELHISRKKFYKLRDGIIYKFAIVFGLM